MQHRQDGQQLMELVRKWSNQHHFVCDQVNKLLSLVPRSEIMRMRDQKLLREPLVANSSSTLSSPMSRKGTAFATDKRKKRASSMKDSVGVEKTSSGGKVYVTALKDSLQTDAVQLGKDDSNNRGLDVDGVEKVEPMSSACLV